MDNYRAVLDFFDNKFPEYRKNRFWIAGESYAGKYIPDLAVMIDKHNQQEEKESNKIDFRGIMVGNGVMTFEDQDLPYAEIQFMIDHSFIDPLILSYYNYACQFDPESAGCGYFLKRYEENTDELNPYSKIYNDFRRL